MLGCWKKDADERVTFTKALQILKGQFNETDSNGNEYII